VLKAMLMSKLKAVIAVMLVLGFITTGATVLVCRPATAQDKPAIAPEEVKAPPKQAPEQAKDGFTVWGKEAGNLQAGLGYYPGQKRAYTLGEMAKLVVRVRNVGKEEVKFQYLREFFIESPPTVTDGEGKPAFPAGLFPLGQHHHGPREVNLAAGKEIELYELKLELKPASESVKDSLRSDLPRFSTLYGTGKFQIQYERVFGMSSGGQFKLDPILGKLATGKLELEIKSEPPAENEKKEPAKQKPEPTALMKTMEGFRTKLGPPSLTGNGFANGKDEAGEPYWDNQLREVATRMGVKTRADCMFLLTYLKDRQLKIRHIAAFALEDVVKAYPKGFPESSLDKLDSDQHRRMVQAFVAGIEKLAK
jgi:hypothetical protein